MEEPLQLKPTKTVKVSVLIFAAVYSMQLMDYQKYKYI